jgi:hypothetical protein
MMNLLLNLNLPFLLFLGKYDAEEYLDWEMLVKQKFVAHLVPDRHKVRQATSEFKDFALIWWASLS